MPLDADNPIVILCAEAEAARVAGDLDRAREMLRQAWGDAATRWERAVAAHYVAGVQPMAAGGHHWHRTAMDEARVAEAEDPDSVRELWPSLHLAFAGSLESVGSPERAAESYRDALDAARALGPAGEGYVRAAEDGIRRVEE
ncbi:MAG: hypothetical protein O2888_02245 [Chloroflexi bacterium]|nr:hypothetical protein [Chloroflexota bacterium]MQC25482.1 hypothetical protein [Chloroflexota bacterium]MQC48294.1 hypothetical protein [Chloroflexota bacterium]